MTEITNVSELRDAVDDLLVDIEHIGSLPKKVVQSLRWKPSADWFGPDARRSEIDDFISLLNSAVKKSEGFGREKADAIINALNGLHADSGAYDDVIEQIAEVIDALGYSAKVATDEYASLLSTIDAAYTERLLTKGEYAKLMSEVMYLRRKIEGKVNAEALRKAAEDAKAAAKAAKKQYREQMRELKAKTKQAKKDADAFDKAQYGERLPSRVSPHVTAENPDEELNMFESVVPTFVDFLKRNYEK